MWGFVWILLLCFWFWFELLMNKIDGNLIKVRMKFNLKNVKCLGWIVRVKLSLIVRLVK